MEEAALVAYLGSNTAESEQVRAFIYQFHHNCTRTALAKNNSGRVQRTCSFFLFYYKLTKQERVTVRTFHTVAGCSKWPISSGIRPLSKWRRLLLLIFKILYVCSIVGAIYLRRKSVFKNLGMARWPTHETRRTRRTSGAQAISPTIGTIAMAISVELAAHF